MGCIVGVLGFILIGSAVFVVISGGIPVTAFLIAGVLLAFFRPR